VALEIGEREAVGHLQRVAVLRRERDATEDREGYGCRCNRNRGEGNFRHGALPYGGPADRTTYASMWGNARVVESHAPSAGGGGLLVGGLCGGGAPDGGEDDTRGDQGDADGMV